MLCGDLDAGNRCQLLIVAVHGAGFQLKASLRRSHGPASSLAAIDATQIIADLCTRLATPQGHGIHDSAKGTLAPASILAESWSIAAEGYDEIFVPRFKPWTDNALALLGSTEFKLPAGDVLVPTCGPGHELPLVAELLKNRNVRGTDLAPGMIDVAQKRCEGNPRLSCAVEDAMEPPRASTRRCSVFSDCNNCLTMPKPITSRGRGAWKAGRRRSCDILADGPRRGKAGPWAHWGRLLRAALGDGARARGPGWEDALPAAIEAAGGEVLFAHPLK